MKFPLVYDIASTSVISVDISSTISNAIEVMLKSTHRNVIVKDNNLFRIFTILDILNIQQESLDLELKLEELDLAIAPTILKNKNILETLEYLNNSIEYICVVDLNYKLYGLITHTDIITNIDPDTLMDNYTLGDFLKLGRRMKWVKQDITTSALLQDMLKASFDNVVIVEKMKPIGIVTTKDIMLIIKSKKSLNLPISHYMSSPVNTIGKDASIKEALTFIKEKHYKRVVVIDENGNLNGIISQKELISLTYSKWAMLMKEYQSELHEINNILENKNREYETIASTDSLTGLYNRYKFSELYLSSYQSMVQRHNDMSLIILDIDLFKKVNDTYGHNIGDKVLIQVSHALLKVLRNIDIVCRWGGEEFVILLPTASLNNAVKLAEKLRVYIEKMEIDIAGSITVSFGVAKVMEGNSMEEVIGRADSALYLAKDSGRNCVKTELEI
ncbi:MAG: diguanylate cyclase [Campylobacterota bacterium]|nr:diguanylate cyclase [Campylobacterota bacterium]